MDFEKIFAVNKFFENEQKTEVQKDISELKHSFFALDSSFDVLLSNYLLIPLTESENEIHATWLSTGGFGCSGSVFQY